MEEKKAGNNGAGGGRIGPGSVITFTPRQVTQEELRRFYELQAHIFEMEAIVHDANADIKRRILAGAEVEPGALSFDLDRRMVRTRKAG